MILPGADSLAASLHDHSCAPLCGDESSDHMSEYSEQAVRLLNSALCDPDKALSVLDRHVEGLAAKIEEHMQIVRTTRDEKERLRHETAVNGLTHRIAGVREARSLLTPYFAIRLP